MDITAEHEAEVAQAPRQSCLESDPRRVAERARERGRVCACLSALLLFRVGTMKCAMKLGYLALVDIMAPDALKVLVRALRPTSAFALRM